MGVRRAADLIGRAMRDPALERAARLLVIDESGAVLLFRYLTDDGPCWATPGGRVEPGESFADAAAREACEELGIVASPKVPLFDESVEFVGRGRSAWRWQRFFVVRVRREEIADQPDVDAERVREGVLETRWWHLADLSDTRERIYPSDLAGRLALANLDETK